MKDFSGLTRWLHILAATLIVWSQDRIQAVFRKLDFENYYMLGVVLIAIAAIQLGDVIATFVINNLRWVRRLMAGKDDIEGDWVAIDFDTAKPTEIAGVEYGRLRYADGRYVLSGDTWSLDGKWLQSYRSEGASYDPRKRELEYYYKQGVARVGGYAIMFYLPHDSLPTNDVCRYFDEDVASPHIVYGERVSMRFRNVPMARRRELALDYGREFLAGDLLDIQSILERAVKRP